MEVNIRKAGMKDLEEIRNLNLKLFLMEHEKFGPAYELDWTMSSEGKKYFTDSIRKEDACTFVAESDGKIIGYLIGWIRGKAPCRKIFRQAELDNMFVSDGFRNREIGSGLVKLFLEWAKSKDVDNIRVGALAGNTEAIRFYRNMGFRDYEVTLEIDFKKKGLDQQC